MSTGFPTSLDSLTNPTASDTTIEVSHSSQHATANDAIEAIEAKVGADSSAVTTSHDYKLSGVTSTDKAVSLTGTETLTNKTLTSPVLNGTLSGTAFLDEDNMASDSAIAVASQQSIKKYVDDNVTAQDLDTAGDTGTGAVDLDSQSLTIAGGSGLETTAGSQTVTVDVSTDGINDTHIDWGVGANQVSAVDVPIADSGAIIIATEVEGALQENRTAIDLNTAKDTYPSADATKVGHISVTQAVDLDTIESDTALNNTHRTSNGSDHSYINQAVTTTSTPTFAGGTFNGSTNVANDTSMFFVGITNSNAFKTGSDDNFLFDIGADNDTRIKMGDNAGVNFVDFADSDWNSVAKIDSNGKLTLGEGTISGVTNSKSITIESPTSSEDITMFFTSEAITITEMRAVLLGSSTPSVTWTIRHNATDRSAAGNEVVTSGTITTSTTAGSDVTSFNDATIPADSFVWIETTAQSGTVTELALTIIYDKD